MGAASQPKPPTRSAATLWREQTQHAADILHQCPAHCCAEGTHRETARCYIRPSPCPAASGAILLIIEGNVLSSTLNADEKNQQRNGYTPQTVLSETSTSTARTSPEKIAN